MNDDYDCRWISHIRSVFDRTGLGYIFTNQIQVKLCNLEPLLFERLRDQFIQVWFSDIENSSRGQFHSTFKTEFCYENYLSGLSEFGRKQISKLRTSNCKILIETGRWQNISREDRFVICVDRLVMNITTSCSAKMKLFLNWDTNIYQGIII